MVRPVCHLANPCSLEGEVDDAGETGQRGDPEGSPEALVGCCVIERVKAVLCHREKDQGDGRGVQQEDGQVHPDHAQLNASPAALDLLARDELAVVVHVAHVCADRAADGDFEVTQWDDEHRACDDKLQPLDDASRRLDVVVGRRCLRAHETHTPM